MAEIRKFLFDTDFGAAFAPEKGDDAAESLDDSLARELDEVLHDAETEAACEEPKPMFFQEDLDAAREAGIAIGREEALGESSVRTEERLVVLEESLIMQMQALQDVYNTELDSIASNAIELAVAVCKRVLPHVAEQHAVDEIHALVAQLLPGLLDHPRILVKVAPELVASVDQMLNKTAEQMGFSGVLRAVADAGMGPVDCRVEWGDGGAERKLADLWARVDELVQATMAESEAGSQAKMPEPVEHASVAEMPEEHAAAPAKEPPFQAAPMSAHMNAADFAADAPPE
jgi:flagellar assembly protein FliH